MSSQVGVNNAIITCEQQNYSVEYDPSGIASIANNGFDLNPGKYFIKFECKGISNNTKISLYSATSDVLICMGCNTSYSDNSDNSVTTCAGSTLITISTSNRYCIKQYRSVGASLTNVPPVTISITKYDDPITSGVSFLSTYEKQTISTTTPLEVNTLYRVDTSNGAFTVTLPPAKPGDYIELIDSTGSFGTHNLTIAASGKYIYVNTNTNANSSIVVTENNSKTKCTYVASNKWHIETPTSVQALSKDDSDSGVIMKIWDMYLDLLKFVKSNQGTKSEITDNSTYNTFSLCSFRF